jgi:nucleoside-diphosphate-sugar epimerase
VEHVERRPGDVHDLCADVTAAATTLGFVPKVTLEDGLRRLHDWYVSQDVAPARLLEAERVRNWMPA